MLSGIEAIEGPCPLFVRSEASWPVDCCRCSRKLMALTARLRRCSDSVSYVMYFCRAGEATTMPLHDP